MLFRVYSVECSPWSSVSCVSALRTFKRILALVCMLSVCYLNVISVSYATPRIVENECWRVRVTGICALKK